MAANPSRNFVLVFCAFGLVSIALLAASGTVEAGMLSPDENAIVFGRADFMFTDGNIADVEYAVYAPGYSFSGGPSYSNQYVYAYQIFVDSTQINGLTVGLDGDEQVANQGSLADPTSIEPNSWDLPGGGYSAVWYFEGSILVADKKSDILYFSSPFPPEVHGSTLVRGGSNYSNFVNLPSPGNVAPEPATLTLFGLAGVVLSLFRPTRRRLA